MARQQFNVNLDPDLVRRVKHHAIDVQQSLSDLVGAVLAAHLDRADQGGIELQPMVHVTEMRSALIFYEALGAEVLHGSRDGDFAMLRFGGAALSLLAHPPNPDQDEGIVELNFECTRDLEQVEAELRAAGVAVVTPTSDEGFGRQLQVRSPDGLLVKINQLETGLYT